MGVDLKTSSLMSTVLLKQMLMQIANINFNFHNLPYCCITIITKLQIKIIDVKSTEIFLNFLAVGDGGGIEKCHKWREISRLNGKVAEIDCQLFSSSRMV
jgi:hypothetical protein